jgi:hypothetical protein
LVRKILPHKICEIKFVLMTSREKAHALLDELDEIVQQLEERAEPEMAELPEAWKTFEDGTPVPNWVAAVHEAREGR